MKGHRENKRRKKNPEKFHQYENQIVKFKFGREKKKKRIGKLCGRTIFLLQRSLSNDIRCAHSRWLKGDVLHDSLVCSMF